MFYLLSVLGAFTLGAIAGILVYRKNGDRLKATEDKGKVLHDGAKVILRAVATKDTRYFTAWQSIVGTEAEVNGKVVELGLT